MKRKKIYISISFTIFLFILIGCTLVGCKYKKIKGSGVMDEVSYELDEFSLVQISGAYKVNIAVGKSPSIDIRAEENIINAIDAYIRKSILIIETKDYISPTEDITITITTNKLFGIESSGANDITVENISSEDFEVNFSGAGEMFLRGKTRNLELDISGAGNLNAENLYAQYVDVDVSGVAKATIYAEKKLEMDVSGLSKIEYLGNPKIIKKSVSGLSSIKKRL